MPTSLHLPPDEHVAGHDFGLLHAQGRNVLANDVGRGMVLLDQRGLLGAAADGLQRQRPGAGEEVQGVFAADGRTNQVEDGLAEAVFHGPGAEVAAVLEFSAPQRPAQ